MENPNKDFLKKLCQPIGVGAVVIFLALINSTAIGIESFPEYWGFQEDEMGLIGRVDWVDSEYTSDRLTFTLPPTWESTFLKNDHAFTATIGSLGAKHFFVRRKLKVREELSKDLNFQLTYFDHSDFDTHQTHLVAEFDTFWNDHWGAAVYTELAYEKRKDDLGFAFLFDTGENHRVRLFYSATDFSRNERNENSDTFAKAPLSYGLMGRWHSTKKEDLSYFTYGFRLEPQMQIDDPIKITTYQLNRKYLFFQRLWGSAKRYDYIELDWKDTEEVHTIKRKLIRWQLTYKGTTSTNKCLSLHRCQVIYGLRIAQRHWEVNNEEIDHFDVLPQYGYQWLISHSSILETSWDISRHKASGPAELRSNNDEDEAYHSRMNLGYEWLFKTSSLKLYFTADLDHFSWEGGNGQFQLFF